MNTKSILTLIVGLLFISNAFFTVNSRDIWVPFWIILGLIAIIYSIRTRNKE